MQAPRAHEALLRVAEAAALAPSSYNTQPWRFRIAGDFFEIHADRTRHLRTIDPDRRGQLLSCGCALFNARVAMRGQGYVDEVTTMIADLEDPDLVATLRAHTPYIPNEYDESLVAAIPKRRTNRRAFLPRAVAAKLSDTLVEAAAVEHATMVRLVPEQKYALAALIDEADRMQYGDPAFRAELEQWLVPTGSRRHDGVPLVEKEYGTALPFSLGRIVHSPTLPDRLAALEAELVHEAPVVFVIGTHSDEPTDWISCGQALEAVLLLATTYGMSAAFLNQVLERAESRGRVAELVPEVGYPHMVLRLGYAVEPVHRIAPRRPIEEMLEIVAAHNRRRNPTPPTG